MCGEREILQGGQVFTPIFTKILHYLSEIAHLKQLTEYFFIVTIGIAKNKDVVREKQV